VNDTFGLVLLESLAAGTPVVAGDSAALPELVDVGGTGHLARPFDVASVAEACVGALRLAQDPATATRCRASAEPYDWVTGIAPLHLEAYERARRG
jgi:glycosyltransferase involved in cell wall biosynthesis